MRRFVKGAIVFLLCGVVTVTSVNAANDVQTFLFTDNPLLENPSGYAGTWGYKDVYASITVTKKGYKKRFSDDGDYSKNKKRLTCETDRVWGPTFKAAGTKFSSKHTAYTKKGAYKSYTKTYKY